MKMTQTEIERSLAARGRKDLEVWAVEMAGSIAEDEAFMLDQAGQVRALVNSLEPAADDDGWFYVLTGLLWGLALAAPAQPEAPPEAAAAPGRTLEEQWRAELDASGMTPRAWAEQKSQELFLDPTAPHDMKALFLHAARGLNVSDDLWTVLFLELFRMWADVQTRPQQPQTARAGGPCPAPSCPEPKA